MRLDLNGLAVTLDGVPILDSVDLAVDSGAFVAVLGPNGSGKSTLLRVVYRAIRPVRGSVCLNGDELWTLSAREAATRRAVVAQQASGGDYTVSEIVSMGRSPHQGLLDLETHRDRKIVVDALRRVGMSHAVRRPMSTLSGGERQRVFIARALAQQAPLMVLDEPTNHLDLRSQLEVLRLTRSLGLTVLAALHDLNHALALADQVLVLDRGRVAAAGPPAEVLTPSLIGQVFGVDAQVGTHPLTGAAYLFFAARAET